nr:DNA-3-methyladenine glycosylase I [Pseudaminobacter soli]
MLGETRYGRKLVADFDAIRSRAAERKGGDAVLRSLLGPSPQNAAVAKLTDDRVLANMSQRIFSAGFVWSVIEQKWPGFEEAFLGFEPKRLLFQSDDFWHDLTSDARIVRNPQKIKSVRENAAFVDKVSREHGGFGKFLAEWPADDQVGLTAWLAKNGNRLGGNTGQYLLRWLGWDTFILSKDMAAALRGAGLDIAEAPSSQKDMRKIQDQINAWVHDTGLSRTHISRILAMSTGENRTPDQLRHYVSE